MSAAITRLFRADPELVVWWAAPVECASAIARLERDKDITESEAEAALGKLDSLAGAWSEVLPTNGVRITARRLLRTHPLRAADALHLAAALMLAPPAAPKVPFVCLDDRLGSAARKEGFAVIGGTT
ncbi:MAG: PIN domain-containing protein [Candidatus Sericytochromatia bacterium]|nr:PIN domain-containing protein [Candidatus Tanganyikabacteria bacterium]